MKIVCHACQAELEVDEALSGHTVECPQCGNHVFVASFTPRAESRRQEVDLDPGRLVAPAERRYFGWVVGFSVLVWILMLIMVVPVLFMVGFCLMIWLVNGLVVAYLRADCVKIDANQSPQLYKVLTDACARLQITKVPELYVAQAGGLLNAFAMRHSGRQFVLIYSDLLDAYPVDSAELRFVIGHELGHIQRNHIVRRIMVLPGLLLPLVGNAYLRACETSCDRYGTYIADDAQASADALLILAGGKNAKQLMDARQFARQYRNDRGFFVSWYELISGYPTLSRRVAQVLALGRGAEPMHKARRHPLAYVFAAFSFGGAGGGGGNILVTIAAVAILAGILMPAIVSATQRGQMTACEHNLSMISGVKDQLVDQYGEEKIRDMTAEEISDVVYRSIPGLRCPAGGEYWAGTLDETAQCSVHGVE